MKLLVLMKAVAANTGGYAGAERQLTELMPNPADITALEEALKLKDACGCSVTVLSMGPSAAASMLRDALARGADSAVLLTDADLAGADTAATSRTIAAAVSRLGGFDLILCGRKTTDGETGQVGPELATRLDVGCMTNCCAISIEDGEARCACLLDGATGTLRGRLPMLVSVVYGINSPRLPSLAGLRRAKSSEIAYMGRAQLGIPRELCGQSGSPTRVMSSYSIPFEKRRPTFVDHTELSKRLSGLMAESRGGEAFHG